MQAGQKVDLQSGIHILQAINSEILMVDRKGIVVFCNQSVCNTLKKQKDEIIGHAITAILPIDIPDLSTVNSDTDMSYELNIDDRTFILNQSPIYEKAELVGAVITFQNVTSDRVSIDGLKQTIEKYENALNLLSECILGVDERGNVTFISCSYAQLLGIDNPQSVIGKHCTEVVENTRMHIVIQTGQAEIGHIQRIGNKNVIATRIPITKEGKSVGAIGKIVFHDLHELKVLANRIHTMESKLEYYQKELKRIQGAKYSFQSIVGNSERIKEVKNNAIKVAKSRSTVLIRGETGTGKELFAHAIHLASPRSEGPFIRLNCAAIPRGLLEAELFGYEDGAFTGAKKGGRPGKFELAQNGTLFLDEIGDMPLGMQAKLLRVLQEKEFERVGGTKVRRVDVRFIAATNQDLWEMTRQGKFREDLYYRLNVFMIDIPPLRERKEDIIPITNFLIDKLNTELGSNIISIDEKVIRIFMEYDWPGNVRELENILERSMNVLEENTIQVHHLPVYLRKRWENEQGDDAVLSLQKEVEMAEKRAIIKALEKVSGNKQEAANLLGIHRASLYRKIEKYNL
ncbi:sigma 54-interacting transcriptional regulator [Bacillus songklensis]|uniref:Sigma 54-interacting transcriptional regulator n=1 Tax=Bacillus songklensis TaxID=1069116 RepID=A0ABV8B864_9BACI